ncbi:hypothetical protein [Bacillus cereus]|uniref:hypothetical protein n=1 Tax=Bacillus cereus TaxID=1396 RepID=UPI003D08FF73
MANIFNWLGRYAYEMDKELAEGFTDDRTQWPEGLKLVAEVLYTLDRQLSRQQFRRVLDAVISPTPLELAS